MTDTNQICYQYLVKKQRKSEFDGYLPEINLNDYRIIQIDYQRAREFILTYEWVGNMGTSKYCFGIFFGENLASVVCYGPPVTPSKYRKLLGSQVSVSVMQLCRGASTYWAPKWAPSKLISSTLKILHKEYNVNVVVAYADPDAGEIGTIYQACNAYYIGNTSPGGGKKYVIHGRIYYPQKVYKKFGSRAREHLKTIDPNFSTIPVSVKHRYIFLIGSKSLKNSLLRKIDALLQPYPKRPNIFGLQETQSLIADE